jgi:hypothetical protein
MEFREFIESEGMMGESVASSLRGGLLAGAMALSPFVSARAESPAGVSDSAPSIKAPIDRELVEELKDSNQYWNPHTMRKIVVAAERGDEWAVREVAWPKSHPLHKKGRPFFRNDKPHPKGLFPYSGH